jgi:hypothetical protein
MRTITKQEVLDAASVLIVQHPDGCQAAFQSEEGGCYYYLTDERGRRTPSCVVGQVFDRLGLLDLVPEASNGDPIERVSQVLARDGLLAFEEDAYALLRAWQDTQDGDEDFRWADLEGMPTA